VVTTVITITVVQYITSNLQPNLSKYGGGGRLWRETTQWGEV